MQWDYIYGVLRLEYKAIAEILSTMWEIFFTLEPSGLGMRSRFETLDHNDRAAVGIGR